MHKRTRFSLSDSESDEPKPKPEPEPEPEPEPKLCSICLEPVAPEIHETEYKYDVFDGYIPNDQDTILVCSRFHKFHRACIMDWCAKNQQENQVCTCPICRELITINLALAPKYKGFVSKSDKHLLKRQTIGGRRKTNKRRGTNKRRKTNKKRRR